MSFVKQVEGFDARYGIPRPAEMQAMPAYQAFLRLMAAGVMMLVLIGCGALSAYLIWLSAGYLEVSTGVRLYFIIAMLACLLVGCTEALQEVLPYYRIQQRLTFGTARWADESYLKRTGLALELSEIGGLPRGSLRVGQLKRGHTLVLPEVEWLRHIAIFGPPGSGKSKTFLMNMLRDIAAGGSAIVLDPKGELFEQTAGSFRQVFRLDLVNPARSDRWNFLPKCKDRPEFAGQMAGTMIGLEGTKHNIADPFWQESELLLLKAVLLHLPDIVAEPTPPMIYEYLALRKLEAIETEMLDSKNKHVKLAWGAFQKAPPQTQGSVITGLMNKLGTFREENAQKVCAPITASDRSAGVRQIEFGRLREYGTVIYIVVAEGDATRYKNLLATFIGQAVNELRIENHAEELAPVGFVLDEAANVPLVGLKEIAGVGRGRKIGLILGYQNLPQVHDQYGQEGGNAILGSIGTMIFLPGLDDVTTQFASRRIGQTTVWSHTSVDGKGKKLDNERQSETGRALMDPTEVRQMVKHQQCVVVIDTSPPIKSAYPPYAVLKQRAIAIEYGEPKLVSLEDAEAEYQKLIKASAEVRAEAREDTPHHGEAEVIGSPAESSPIARETIDGGMDYQSDELIPKGNESGSGEPAAKESGARGMQKKKNRPPDIEIRQYTFFSDQGVQSKLLDKAKEELEKNRPRVMAHTNDGTTLEGDQVPGVFNSAAVTAHHDSLR
ncbi:MAG: type IV secretory system conjugative DNA transfer family protein [Acidobacteria bacterium]|nr:type IV secretory system conjugative DNA transfer family protein [Acidobacteriota bacterium]